MKIANWVLLILIVVASLACNPTRKTSRRGSSGGNNNTTRIKEKPTRIDTISWRKDGSKTPINDDTPLELKSAKLISEKKSVYNVSLCIPFQGQKFHADQEELNVNSKRFINFYGGVKLAIEDLRKEGIDLNIDVYDTEYSESKFESILRLPSVRSADVVVGPYKRNSVKTAAEWAKKKKTTVVSPWLSSSTFTAENSYFLQFKPGLIKHYETMLFHAMTEFSDEEIYLVIKEGDRSKLLRFEQINTDLGGSTELLPYVPLELNVDSMTYGFRGFEKDFFTQGSRKKVFIVPYSSMKDAGFAYDFLRRIQIEHAGCETVVYGMYRWIDFQDEMLEIMNAMNVRLTISNLVNPESRDVSDFKNRYFNKYGAIPMDDAYEGYDVMYHLGSLLEKYGNCFQAFTEDIKSVPGIQTVLDLQPEYSEDGEVDYFENQFIDIIEFDEYLYKRVK